MSNMQIVKSNLFGEVKCDFWQDEKGNILMTRKQIGEALEYSNPNDAIRKIHARHLERFKKFSRVVQIDLPSGGKQELYLYTHKGIMEVCRWSQQAKADDFIDWVWDVIEEIRKTGYYSINQKLDSYMIDDPIVRAKRWIEEQQEKILLAEKIEQDKPLVTFAETALKSSDNILVRELAKILCDEGINVGERRLYTWLRAKKLIMSNSTEPYQSALDKGIFVREEKAISTPYGKKLVFTTKVTPKGQVYITEKYKEELQLSKTA